MDNEVLPFGKILSAWRTLYVARYEAYTVRTSCRHGLSKVGLLKRHSIFPISSLVVLLLRPNPQNLAMPHLLFCPLLNSFFQNILPRVILFWYFFRLWCLVLAPVGEWTLPSAGNSLQAGLCSFESSQAIIATISVFLTFCSKGETHPWNEGFFARNYAKTTQRLSFILSECWSSHHLTPRWMSQRANAWKNS